jgi:pyruvate/2-oxoglutarate dehydrogenase complex dihydrolipoamide dehydrogenase (E3) component
VRVRVELDQAPEVNADELAVAVGRHPRTDDLRLETVGLEPGNWIDVDDQLRATAVEDDWLYAVGDVNARALLSHHVRERAVVEVISGRVSIEAAEEDRGVRGRNAGHV